MYQKKDFVNKTYPNSLTLFRHQPEDLDELLTKLLISVAHGDQNTAEQILQKHPELMTKKGKLCDYSGRSFFYISAFEYALWALDTRYMIDMILQCLPIESGKLTVFGVELSEELLQQYHNMNNVGVAYALDGVTYTNEKRFDINPLLAALEIYIKSCEDNCQWTERAYNFYNLVGKAQYYLPAHVIQHYCNPNVDFYSDPSFNAERFERCLNCSNLVNNTSQMVWASEDLILGKDFALMRGAAPGYASASNLGSPEFAKIDLAALKTLITTRLDDNAAIELKLKTILGSVPPRPR